MSNHSVSTTVHPHIRLFLFPSFNRNNKYIELLTTALRQYPQIEQVPLSSTTLWGVLCFLRKHNTPYVKNILHIQWSTVLYGSRFFLKSLGLLMVHVVLLAVFKSWYRGKVVWTVHNAAAHDYPHARMDRLGRWILLTAADCIIVQQRTTLQSYRQRYPTSNLHYIPHGNYVGAYGPLVARDQVLRDAYGFKKEDVVLLSLGAIAPYKRNSDIIDIVLTAQKRRSDLKLLIIGKGTEAHVADLMSRIPLGSGIVIRNEFVPDAEIPRYIAMADYAIFYYDDSEMTSGGLVLALSYGLPVIARNIAATEVIHSGNGRVGANKEELILLVQQLSATNTAAHRSAIIAGTKEQDWRQTTKMLVDLYNQL